jgi:hypothetical protein
MQGNLDLGVTSVGLSMPSAFTVTGSPVTSSGNISVVGAGTVSQYIRGDGSLADFPQGGGGGGSSVNYYLNGSVSQGTIGGIAYTELSKVPILGTGTDFTINADGYIASFITDAGDPSLLQIPGGNWNFETYFQASSGGGTPTFYVELYKVDSGGTATLIASSSGSPELIAFGTNITPYFSSLAVPTTTLALTDRLALRYYVTHSGRTITLHTENNTLCQIITTFTTGLTALNGLTAQVQNFATGTSGTDFGISSATSTHTFNLPTASATNRGALSSADWTTFNGKQNALNGTGFVKISGTTISYDNSTYLTTSSAGSTYVPYTGANQLVNLGYNALYASQILINGTSPTGGSYLGFKHSTSVFTGADGYTSMYTFGTNTIAFKSINGSTNRDFSLSMASITPNVSGGRVYTLPDASGTLALTSDISSALLGYVTLGTVQTITALKTFSTTGAAMAEFNSTFATGGVLSLLRNGVNVGNIGNSGSLTVGILDDLEIRSASAKNIHLRTDATQFTLSPSGGATLFSANSSTPLLILNTTGTNQPSGIGTQQNGANKWAFGTNFGSADDSWNVYNYTAASRFLTIASTGAATFSSSVTTKALSSTTSGSGNLTAYIGNSVTSASGSTGYGLAIESEASAATSYAMTVRNLAGSNTYFHISTETGKVGNVGIGTASPTARLSIIGPNELSTFFIAMNNGAAGATFSRIGNSYPFNRFLFQNGYLDVGASYMTYPVSIEAQSGGGQLALTRGGAVAELYMGGTTGGSTVLYVRSGGSGGVYLAAGSTGWVANSDERLKTDLVPIENGLEKVASLRSVIGRYLTDDEDKKRAFLIAQDVEKVLPEAVVTIEETGDMGVNYTEVIPLLVAAIKELKTEIDSLKNQIK